MIARLSKAGRTTIVAIVIATVSVVAAAGIAWSSLRARASQGPLNGLWRSDGYGLGLEIAGTRVQAFEMTSVSRLSAWQANGRFEDRDLVFMRNGCERRLVSVLPNGLRLHSSCSAADILFAQAPAWASTANNGPSDNPVANYAVFWQTFAEIYPFFNLRRVDWGDVDRRFRPRVASTTTPQNLFGMFREMIEPLRDAHTSLQVPQNRLRFRGVGAMSLTGDQFVRWASTILPKYARGVFTPYCKDRLWFGMVDNGVGYLLITAFAGLADGSDHTPQVQALETALDSIFKDADQLTGLIIDVRQNDGGYNGLGVAVAARLTTARYLAYMVKARNNVDGPLRFTPPQSVWVEPSSRPGFKGRVAMLIGPGSVSGAETFAMSVMGRQPAVTFVGENTQGVYSEIVGRTLPNGWNVSLPTEVYETAAGRSFDGVGVAPGVRVHALRLEDLDAGKDPILERALALLR